jgi:hypothetical protein
MTTDITRPHRSAATLALLSLLLVAGCQNVFSMVDPRSASGAMDGLGASASAEEYLGAIRKEYGLPPLALDPTLEKAAVQQAGYMAGGGKMAHRTGWGRDFASRMHDNGVRGVDDFQGSPPQHARSGLRPFRPGIRRGRAGQEVLGVGAGTVITPDIRPPFRRDACGLWSAARPNAQPAPRSG